MTKRPLPPALLADALTDSIHVESNVYRPARGVRYKDEGDPAMNEPIQLSTRISDNVTITTNLYDTIPDFRELTSEDQRVAYELFRRLHEAECKLVERYGFGEERERILDKIGPVDLDGLVQGLERALAAPEAFARGQ